MGEVDGWMHALWEGLPVCEGTAWMNGIALGDGHQAGEGSRIRMRRRSLRVLLWSQELDGSNDPCGSLPTSDVIQRYCRSSALQTSHGKWVDGASFKQIRAVSLASG